MRSVKAIQLLLLFFVLIAAKDELYAVNTSFNLALRTTLDTAFTNSQFMTIGWAEKASKIPAPPAPPGDNFYAYIDGFYFKELRAYVPNQVQSWDFYFTLSTKQLTRNLYVDFGYIKENTDYAVVTDEYGNELFDLHTDSIIVLDQSQNGKFSISVMPKTDVAAPQVLPTFNNKIQSTTGKMNSYQVDLKSVFINTQKNSAYRVDTFSNSSLEYAINDEEILTLSNTSLNKEIRIRVFAKNEHGENFADIFFLPNVLTDIEENEIPEAVQLNQNYPNPFNPSTTISFDLNEATRVQLTVYNLNGQKVATLIQDSNLHAGTHTAHFDAANLPSGLYLYRLQTSNTVLTKKMTLLK